MTPGTRLLLVGRLERRGFQVSEFEFLAPDWAADERGGGDTDRAARPASGTGPPGGIHTTGLVAVHPANGAACERSGCANGPEQACAYAPNAIEALPAELRARRGLARRRRCDLTRFISPPTMPS